MDSETAVDLDDLEEIYYEETSLKDEMGILSFLGVDDER